MNKTKLFLVLVLSIGIASSYGCESFRKKFIRKKKSEPVAETMVIYPRDYSKEQLPSDQAYQRYYTYWRAWHMELLTHLNEDASKKKIVSCFEQTILNLSRMKKLLANQTKADKLQVYIETVTTMQGEVEERRFDILPFARLKQTSDLLFREIQRDFAFKKIKDELQ